MHRRLDEHGGFIAGYPGSEHGLRATMAQVLGEGKAQFFFDRLLDYINEKYLNQATLAGYSERAAPPSYTT